MKENEPVEVQLSEKIARLRDLFVRRTTKMETSDNCTDYDMRHDPTKRPDGIHDSGVTATGHENAVFRQQRLLFKNVIALCAGLVAIERLAVVLAGRSLAARLSTMSVIRVTIAVFQFVKRNYTLCFDKTQTTYISPDA